MSEHKHVDKKSLIRFGICFLSSLLFGLYGASFMIGASITKEYTDFKLLKHWCIADNAFDIMGVACGLFLNRYTYHIL